MKNVKQIQEKLKSHEIDFNLEIAPGAPLDTKQKHDQLMEKLGFENTCATLVLYADGKLVALLRRGDTKVDNNALRAALGASKTRFLSVKELKQELDMQPGMVSPVFLPKELPVFIDKKVLEKQRMFIGSGEDKHSLEISTESLVKLTNPKKVDVTEINLDRTDVRILSGITPSSSKGLHLGNYLGAVKPQVDFQDKGECFYFIADYHALNTVFEGQQLRENIQNTFLDYLALGIDVEKTVFFVESHARVIFELTEILNNVVNVGQMMRMHAFKDKLQDESAGHESINMGLFTYPILMAADILAFEPDIIPVGEDQRQHVEVCRDMAIAFNNRYGDILKVPEVYVQTESAKVVGTDGQRKMSKSLGNDLSIFGEEDLVKQQVMGITTDPNRIKKDDPGDPDKNVIFDYMQMMDYDSHKREVFIERYREGSVGDVEIKKDFLEFYLDYFQPMRKKRKELASKPEYVKDLIRQGAQSASAVSERTIAKVREAIGAVKLD